MAKYNVIIKQARTGEQKVVETITAGDEKEAKRYAIKNYLGKFNMIFEHLLVARA